MIESDVIVVGGGPAGSTCARTLVDQGLEVTLLDKARFPRDKPCAGWVTPPVLKALNLDPEEYGREHVISPITGFRTGIMGQEIVSTGYDEIVSYGIRRCEFDTWLIERCGANVVQDCHVKSIEREGARWIINRQYSAPMLVCAAGFSCHVVRAIDANSKQGELAVAAKEVEFELDERERRETAIDEGTPELFFCDDLKGYGWCFRKGNYLNVGIGREDKQGLGNHLESFVDFLKTSERISCQLPKKFPGHAYLIYGHSPKQLLDDGALLLGDSAGLAYPR
ncbi:MAG: FAD-dependent oxidoreductase, partial [Pseudomonadales bacterium]|nr:FAD-dependent oxidoreductase [Pseudomonadales bacterium]